MQIAVISDIHFNQVWGRNAGRFARQLQTHQPDLLILAGDIGEPIDMFAKGLKAYGPVCELRAALAGNHDVWHRPQSYTSQALWESKLEEVARSEGYHWLDRANLKIGSLGVCGSIGWYDYRDKHPDIYLTDDEYQVLKPLISNDGNFIDWPWTDREFAQQIVKDVATRLDELENDPQVADIVLATHVPIFEGLQRSIMSPANAYYANLSLGDCVRRYSKVRVVLSGHVHRARHKEIVRDDLPPLMAYTIPSEYGEPAALLVETETWQVDVLRDNDATG